MNSVFAVLEKYWYLVIVLLAFYILIILIIEIKDLNYFNFNLKLKKHEYKETNDWYRINDLFLQDFKYFKDKSIEDIVKKIHRQFSELISISFKVDTDLIEEDKLELFIINTSDKEIQLFLKDPLQWVNQIIDENHVYLLESSLKKNKKTYNKLFPNLVRLEKSFLKELNLESIETNMNFQSEIYKQINTEDKIKS